MILENSHGYARLLATKMREAYKNGMLCALLRKASSLATFLCKSNTSRDSKGEKVSDNFLTAVITLLSGMIGACGSIAAVQISGKAENGVTRSSGIIAIVTLAGAGLGLLVGYFVAPSIVARTLGTPPPVVQCTSTPPTSLIRLQDNTNPSWSGDIWGSRNMISFIGNVGEVDTSRPTFGDFQIWIDPCSENPYYKSGAQFCPREKLGINCDSTVIHPGGAVATTIKLPPNTGKWGLGNR